jgi:hypothetical protein
VGKGVGKGVAEGVGKGEGKGVEERVGKVERLTRAAIETHRQDFESAVEVRTRHADQIRL